MSTQEIKSEIQQILSNLPEDSLLSVLNYLKEVQKISPSKVLISKIDKKDVLSIHKVLIDKFGGAHGVRDESGLESAINRPYSTFDAQELYPSPEEKSAAIIESLLINHPFIDGNKRIGYVIMRLLLMSKGKDINASEEEKYQFVIGIASGKLKYEAILSWIKNNLKKE